MGVKRIGSLILMCLLFLFPVSVRAEKEESIDMYLKYGFQDNVRSGSCFPLNIYMENHGDAFKGTLEISVPVQAEDRQLSASIWMGSEWGTHKDRVYCYKKDISLAEGESREETFYLEIPAFDGYMHVCLKDGSQVVSERELTCSFSENNSRVLVGVIASSAEGMGDLDGMQIQSDNGYGMEAFVKVIPLKPEEIYPNPDALNQLDVLIVDAGTGFSQEQQIALTRWKDSGGFYIERTGENLYKLFLDFLSGENGDEFQKYLGWMVSYSFGDDWGLSQVPVKERPSMGKFFIFLCVYAVIAGPVMYLSLKKRGRQKYLWTCICALSVVFMGVIGLLGKKTYIYAPFISYSGIYEQQEDVWSETAGIGIQAPYNNDYHLYLDSEYRLLPLNLGTDSLKSIQSDTAEHVTIRLGEDSNRISLENIASFTQSCFKLEKNRKVGEDEKIHISLAGDGDRVSGTWKNPTGYDIRNAVLVMRNRAAVLGDMAAGEEGDITECTLYSVGNSGMEILMKEQMNFDGFEYPDYEISNLSSRVWSVLRNEHPGQTYLLGIVENPDLTFQKNSGYKIYGSALFQMAVDVDWSMGGYQWCPNLETTGTSQNGEFSYETNLMHGKEATVDYQTDIFEQMETLTFFQADYDDERYFFPFQGNVALYCWETGTFEEIQNWETTLQGEKLKRFLSQEGVIRVRYLLDDTLNTTDRVCMLPCLKAAGKVE